MTNDQAARASRAVRRLALPAGMSVDVFSHGRGGDVTLTVSLTLSNAPGPEVLHFRRPLTDADLNEIRGTAASMANVAAYAGKPTSLKVDYGPGDESPDPPPEWLAETLRAISRLSGVGEKAKCSAVRFARSLEFDGIQAPGVKPGPDGHLVEFVWFGGGPAALFVMVRDDGKVWVRVEGADGGRHVEVYDTRSRRDGVWLSMCRLAVRYVLDPPVARRRDVFTAATYAGPVRGERP